MVFTTFAELNRMSGFCRQKPNPVEVQQSLVLSTFDLECFQIFKPENLSTTFSTIISAI